MIRQMFLKSLHTNALSGHCQSVHIHRQVIILNLFHIRNRERNVFVVHVEAVFVQTNMVVL